MTVKDFMKQYPDASFDMMTPDGLVFLTAEQAKALVSENTSRVQPGGLRFATAISAKELLSEQVVRTNWESNVCHMLTDYVQEEEQLQLLQNERIKKEIRKAGYAPTEKLMESMKEIEKKVGRVVPLEEVRDMYQNYEKLAPELQEAVGQAAKSFMAAEKGRQRAVPELEM